MTIPTPTNPTTMMRSATMRRISRGPTSCMTARTAPTHNRPSAHASFHSCLVFRKNDTRLGSPLRDLPSIQVPLIGSAIRLPRIRFRIIELIVSTVICSNRRLKKQQARGRQRSHRDSNVQRQYTKRERGTPSYCHCWPGCSNRSRSHRGGWKGPIYGPEANPSEPSRQPDRELRGSSHWRDVGKGKRVKGLRTRPLYLAPVITPRLPPLEIKVGATPSFHRFAATHADVI